ncbi:lipoprotein [Spiroplasma clarkii]|uniref:Lipoprotein n=2 Tax=Spiroplasma clarkii TaxID=2139 RepID=A0A2K8KP93_9MOLU|nr:lipoprotein [Spiroplasma clarkii]ATX70916.1 hypothetical protein SCLAR_v1c05970 [Spiroplasma clarkii]
MKKLLSVIGATTLITSTTASVAACSKEELKINVETDWITRRGGSQYNEMILLMWNETIIPRIKNTIIKEYNNDWSTKIEISYLTFGWQIKGVDRIYATLNRFIVSKDFYNILAFNYTIRSYSLYSVAYSDEYSNHLSIGAIDPTGEKTSLSINETFDTTETEQIPTLEADYRIVVDMRVKKLQKS